MAKPKSLHRCARIVMVKRLFDVIEADFIGGIDNKMNLSQLKGLKRRNSPLRIGNGPRRMN